MHPFHGIIVYEILEDGNLLNAIYTNTGLLDPTLNQYHIDNEIARRTPFNDEPIGGIYRCRYIEHKNSKVTEGELRIKPRDEVYECEWWCKGQQDWVGIGLRAGKRHLAVSYVKSDQYPATGANPSV
jgi:hypothetical protein